MPLGPVPLASDASGIGIQDYHQVAGRATAVAIDSADPSGNTVLPYVLDMTNPNANASAIDPDSEEVQQLKSAAMPLLFQLREDQKEEVRKLARIIGLEKVASAI